MAASNTTTKKCATCMQNSDEQKAKSGITLCEGCHQIYCLSHFVEHRQTLNKILEDITGQRDLFRSRLEELPKRLAKEHLTTIDDWKNMMLQTVTEAATNAQLQVHQLLISEMERECSELTSQITSFRDNEDYFETDVKKLQGKVEKLSEELNDLPGLSRFELNLPTFDFSNMVHIKSVETPANSVPEIVESNDTIILEPKKQYRSFIEHFLTTKQPSIDLNIGFYGRVCASPTMTIDIIDEEVYRVVFHRQSTSEFSWTFETPLDVRWSFWLQQFIVLMKQKVAVIDAVEKQSQVVIVEDNQKQLQCMNHWKDRCLITDNKNRLFLYKMNKNLTVWFLVYCWSPPTTCKLREKITAIALNDQCIVLSTQYDDQCRFSVRKRDMTYCSDIQLIHPCTAIQALPQNEWLLYDSSRHLYYVIDAELVQHDEPYLSSLKDAQIGISCEETDKTLTVFLSETVVDSSVQKHIKVYTNNFLL